MDHGLVLPVAVAAGRPLAEGRVQVVHPLRHVDRHLHRIGLPSLGGRTELSEIAGHIASLPLDRTRPLWEMWVIENIAGTDAQNGGRIAVMTKVHHAAVDGVTGANLMSKLCTTEPDAPPPDPVEASGQGSDLEIAVSGAVRFAARPLKLANVVPTTVSSVIDTVRRARNGSHPVQHTARVVLSDGRGVVRGVKRQVKHI